MSARPLFVVTVLLILGCGAASGQTLPRTASLAQRSLPARHVVVSWKSVPGAMSYEMLIRPLGGDTIIDRMTKSTSVAVVLTPGTYQVRVISFDIFDKPASASRWRYLDVIRIYAPVVDKVVPTVLYSGVAGSRLTISGGHFIAQTTVELVKSDRTVARATIDRQSGDRILLHFDLARVPPGRYALRVANPEKLLQTLPEAIEVLPRIQPELSSLTLHRGYNDRVYPDVAVEGGGFVAGTTFSLRGAGSTIEIPRGRLVSDSRELLNINLGNASPGRYDLVAVDPGGLSARLAAAVTVMPITSPVFLSMSPASFTIGRGTGTFVLRARRVIPGALVLLRRRNLTVPTVAADAAPHDTPTSGVETNTYKFDLALLPPGHYAVVIENSRLLSATVPDLVTVRARPVPAVFASSLTRGISSRNYPNVVLSGVNLLPSFRVALQRGAVRYGLSTRFVSPRRLDYDLDLRGLQPGTYRLLVVDSGRVVASLPGGIAVRLKPKPLPAVTASSLTLGYDDRSYRHAALTGRNFLPAYHVALERAHVFYELTSRYVSPQRIDFDADLRGLAPGRYRLLVQDLLGTVASLHGGIEVSPPPPRPHPYFHPGWTALTLGYPYSFGLTPSFAQAVTGSRIGGIVNVSFPAGERLFPMTPGVRDVRLGLAVADLLFQRLSGSASPARLNLTTAGSDFAYRSPFNSPLNATAAVGYGLAYGAFSLSPAAGSTIDGSLAFYVSFTGGAELDIGRNLIVDAGVEWMRVFFPSASFDSLSPFIRAGIRLGGKPRPNP